MENSKQELAGNSWIRFRFHITLADVRALKGMHPNPRKVLRNLIRNYKAEGNKVTMTAAVKRYMGISQ